MTKAHPSAADSSFMSAVPGGGSSINPDSITTKSLCPPPIPFMHGSASKVNRSGAA